jgi:hypothetical protein
VRFFAAVIEVTFLGKAQNAADRALKNPISGAARLSAQGDECAAHRGGWLASHEMTALFFDHGH